MNYQQIQKQTFSFTNRVWTMPVVPQLAMGVLFVGLYLLELLQGPTIEPLFQLQQQDVYRQITGFLLMVYVLFQWRLAWRRMGRRKIDHKRELNLHMWLGVFTPLVLYVHSSQMGYGYQALFLGVFLTNVLVGLCSPALLKIRHKSYVVYWLVLHSGLAVLVPVLLTYHLYVIYFYD